MSISMRITLSNDTMVALRLWLKVKGYPAPASNSDQIKMIIEIFMKQNFQE